MSKKIIPWLTLSFIIGINLYFGLPRLQNFAGIDEPLWSYGRVPKFWKSIEKQNWKGTSLCDKPGITLAAISGTGLPFSENPKDYEKLRYEVKTPEQAKTIRDIHFNLRLPVFIFTLATLPIFYFFLKRLFEEETALFSVLFIGLSPILLGISLMINTDALLWNLVPLTLLSFFIYQKENNRKFLYLSGLFLGLALITKFVANLLFPFIFLLFFLRYILDKKISQPDNYFKKAVIDYGTLVFISIATVFIFYPAAWVKPKTLLDVTIFSKAFYKTWPWFFGFVFVAIMDIYLLNGKIIVRICDFFRKYKKIIIRIIYSASLFLIVFAIANTYSGMKIFDFQPIFNFPSAELGKIQSFLGDFNATLLSSFYPLIFGLTPVVAIFFVTGLIVNLKQSEIKEETIYLFSLICFILAYYLASALSEVAPTVRYQIVVYPLASIIAAFGLNHVLKGKTLRKYFTASKFYLLLAVIFLSSIISLLSIKPFYLSYASNLLPKKYVLNLRDMGDGSWEIAQYLNNLPNAVNLKIWSDKGAVCESFVGKCFDSLKKSKVEDVKFDYFVVSAGREAKSLYMATLRGVKFSGDLEVEKIYDPGTVPELRIDIDNRPRNFIKVIKADNLKN